MGRRALEQLQKRVNAKSGDDDDADDDDAFDVDESIRNGLNIFINFNANGSEDVFQEYERPASPTIVDGAATAGSWLLWHACRWQSS